MTTEYGHQLKERQRRYAYAAQELRWSLVRCDFDLKHGIDAEVFNAVLDQALKLEQAAIALEDEYKDKN